MFKKIITIARSKAGAILSLVLVTAAGFSSLAFTVTPPPPDTYPDVIPGGKFVEKLAEELNMSIDDLRQALKDGKTIAEIADEKMISLDVLADSLLQNRKDRLDQAVEEGKLTREEADLVLQNTRDRLMIWMNTGKPPLFARVIRFRRGSLIILSDELGMSVEELRQAIKDGKTVSELAETEGVSLEDILAALIAPFEGRLDKAVNDDRMDQEKADKVLHKATDRITRWLETGERIKLQDRMHYMVQSQLGEVAALLGMDEEALTQALRNGQTIAEIAETQNASLEEIVSVMVSPLADRLDQAVASGNMTRELADSILEKTRQRLLLHLEAQGE